MRKLFVVVSILFVVLTAWKFTTSTLLKDSENPFSPPAYFPVMEYPADNAYTDLRWMLGKKLFYDPILSLDSSISCASCHNPIFAFSDSVSLSPGIMNRPGIRNAPSLANVGYHPYFLREGSVSTLEMQILVPVQEENEFGHNIVAIGDQLNKMPEYVAMSIAAYGRLPDPYVITHAIAVFERTLISGNSAYDCYLKDSTAMSESQIRGMQLFFSDRLQCAHCHGGFNFTEYAFENNGLDTAYVDIGRMRFTNNYEDDGLFKVPGLRNVSVTAPYMHDGSISSLEEVIEHYNGGGKPHPNKSPVLKPLYLSAIEKTDLVAFLFALTDTSFIQNSMFSKDFILRE